MNLICWIIFTLLLLQPNSLLANSVIANSLAIEKNTRVIEDLFTQNKDHLLTGNVRDILNDIIEQRDLYSENTRAKVFILFADLANNLSDVERSFQFSLVGSKLLDIDLPLKLNLLLKVAAGYYTKGQYQEVLIASNEAITLAKTSAKIKYHLLALAYRSMAYILINNYSEAFTDLKNIEGLLERNKPFEDNIELLEIISSAHHYLGNYQTVLMINKKILKLRFDLSSKYDLVNTYYHLASAYHHLGLLDDAYNAYWETKRYAQDNGSQVDIAFAELGLGEVLFLQKNYQASYVALIKAANIFKEKSLSKSYLSTLIALAKVSLLTGREEFSHQLLKQAENMIPVIKLSSEQIELYLLLAEMYQDQQNYAEALVLLQSYIELNKEFVNNRLAIISLQKETTKKQDEAKELSIKLVEKSALNAIFYKKFQQQQLTIIALVVTLFVIIFLLTIFALKKRSKKMNVDYDAREKTPYFLECPAKIKHIYQSAYKQARKYNYPLTIGYVSIDNWKELTFRFNKKALHEVSKTIAILINEHIGEFDHAGVINDGEYLLLFPHQKSSTIEKSFTGLKESLNVRLFANLGGEAVNIHFSLDIPTIQDIDPYIFLSKLRDTALPMGSRIEYSSHQTMM